MASDAADPPSPSFRPLGERLQDRTPRIPATMAMVLANVLVFAAMLAAGAGLWHTPNQIQLAWGANFGPATKDGEWWRLATAMFLHFGLVHLGMNMFALWDGGRLVERMYGHGRFLAIYVAAGLTGNLVSLIAQGDRAVSGGASGAIFGIYGALMVFLWRERQNLHATEFRWLFWGAAGFTAVTIVLGLLVPGIDNAAHLGGLAAGTLAGAALAVPLTREKVRLPPRLAAAAALLAGWAWMLTHVPAPRYDWSDELAARGEIREFLAEDARISAEWQSLLDQGRRGGLSFEELAGRIESRVAERYERNFEDLAGLHLDPATPSAATVEALRRYAELRRDASRDLAEAIRTKDSAKVRAALEKAKQADSLAGRKPAQDRNENAGRKRGVPANP